MRRSFVYMGQRLTTRHLNAVRSPLATGFIRPNTFLSSGHGLAASSLLVNGLLSPATATDATTTAASAVSLDASANQMLAMILSSGSPFSTLMNIIGTMNLGLKQESFRIETIMGGMREECFNLCCKDLSTNELSTDEVNCVDRCSWRYLSTYAALSQALDRTGKTDIAKKV